MNDDFMKTYTDVSDLPMYVPVMFVNGDTKLVGCRFKEDTLTFGSDTVVPEGFLEGAVWGAVEVML